MVVGVRLPPENVQTQSTLLYHAEPVSIAFTKPHLVCITNLFSNSVSFIDGTRFEKTGTVPVGSEPEQTLLAPDGTTGYVLNAGVGTVSVLNTARKP